MHSNGICHKNAHILVDDTVNGKIDEAAFGMCEKVKGNKKRKNIKNNQM